MPKKSTVAERFRKSFPELDKPKGGLPTMPTKISGISSNDLGDLYARYSAWREFCEDRHIDAVKEYMEAKAAYDNEWNKQMATTNKEKVTEAKAEVESSPEMLALGKTLVEKEMYLKMIGGKLESFTNSLTTLSRELTRRGMVLPEGA